MADMNPLIPFCALLLALAVYMLPSAVAAARNHRNFMAIFVLNLFLGWTFVAWALALVWASTVSVEVRRHG